MKEYHPVIGLEIHAQLSTSAKLFCNCRAVFGAEPNTQVCPICLGMPGVLPVPNRKAVEYAVKMGLATHCVINRRAMWTRKNYFYPDLPKGYQITQQGGTPVYDHPICAGGYLEIPLEGGSFKRIGITRLHLEEDAGKLIHDIGEDTAFDANRCGTPLLEIVSEPDIRSPGEAYAYLVKIKQVLEYLEICDANMEKGNLRCDANISLRPLETSPFGQRVEIKNMNSFHNLETALESEIELQSLILSRGEPVKQETKRWDPAAGKTVAMRLKEKADDYRYFPEPDMVRLSMVSEEFIKRLKAEMPELPDVREKRFKQQFGLTSYNAQVLTAEKPVSEYFEAVCQATNNYKSAANWVMGKVLNSVKENESDITAFPVKPSYLGDLIKMIDEKLISGRMAKAVFDKMVSTGMAPEQIVKEQGLRVISDEGAIHALVKDIFTENPNQVQQFREGKTKVLGFFIGKIMQKTQGKASPEIVNRLLKKELAR